MDKAILIIDMPDSCNVCPCIQSNYDEGEIWCGVTGEAIYTTNKKHKDCPLKPVPEEQDVWYDDERSDWERGYNNCVREIVGR